ncbi:hypothetical protein [Rhizobium yanglingense]
MREISLLGLRFEASIRSLDHERHCSPAADPDWRQRLAGLRAKAAGHRIWRFIWVSNFWTVKSSRSTAFGDRSRIARIWLRPIRIWSIGSVLAAYPQKDHGCRYVMQGLPLLGCKSLQLARVLAR